MEATMNGRRAWILVGMAAIIALGLAGCADAITVHSIAKGSDETPDVPAVDGRWRLATDEDDASILVVEHRPGDKGRCRAGTVTYIEDDEADEAGDEVCLIELNGQLLAEFHTTKPADFYRQYLVRIRSDRIEVCGGLPVWILLKELKDDRPVGYSLDSLQYTMREQEKGDLMVIISQPDAMRAFLEIALPELGSACDLGDHKFTWAPFERLPDGEKPAAEGAASE
jgi:hypothetical protein